MDNVILTSSFATVANELQAKGILPRAPQRVALIPTASTYTVEHPWLEIDRKALLGLGYNVFDVELCGKTAEEIKNEIQPAQILFVAGGNTIYLADQVHRVGFAPLVREALLNGKIYIGSSAGSILAGPTVEPFLEEDLADLPKDFHTESLSGLGLVPYVILPHHPQFEAYDRKAIQKFGERFSFLQLTDQEYRTETVRLNQGRQKF
ncbi:MAG TPA: Type 1 glutamine amidotransferase-like domain-containing protein [Patescibacteria group bacterium]|nr:Type 1 glutamine amidotransferase-like domain-containing protein [Patescibacteria group bacterium]